MKRLVQALGLFIFVVGVVLTFNGGYYRAVPWAPIPTVVPVHLILIIMGVLFTAAPKSVLWFGYVVTPDRWWFERLKNLLEEELRPYRQAGPDDPHVVAETVYKEVDRLARNSAIFWLVAATVIIAALIGFPFLIKDYIVASNFQSQSIRLAELVQETKIAASSGDQFRNALATSRQSINAYRKTKSVTPKLFDTLDKLFNTSKRNSESLAAATQVVYRESIAPFVDNATGLLDISKIRVSDDPTIDPPEVLPAYLTLLAVVAIDQGNQGQYVGPYIQARQLAHLAEDIAVGRGLNLPTTFNSLGLAYSSLIKCWDDYESTFQLSEGAAADIQDRLGESHATMPLKLALRADYYYQLATEASDQSYPKARFLNNKVDLRLTLIREAHLAGREFKATNADEEAFLSDEIVVPKDDTVALPKLAAAIERLQTEIREALAISQTPELFYTCAQLQSLAGELAAKYSNENGSQEEGPWISTDRLKHHSVTDLRTARNLGLDSQYFAKAHFERLGLSWATADLPPTAEDLEAEAARVIETYH